MRDLRSDLRVSELGEKERDENSFQIPFWAGIISPSEFQVAEGCRVQEYDLEPLRIVGEVPWYKCKPIDEERLFLPPPIDESSSDKLIKRLFPSDGLARSYMKFWWHTHQNTAAETPKCHKWPGELLLLIELETEECVSGRNGRS